MNIKKAILVSNVLDPLTHNDENLKAMYLHLAMLNRYDAVETRLIENEEVRDIFNELAKENDWHVNFWITGNLARANLNLSSLDEAKRKEAIKVTKVMMDEANRHVCHNFGIGSGIIEDINRHEEQVDFFVASLKELMDYKVEKGYTYQFLNEPLDQDAHKNNTIGNLETTVSFIKKLEEALEDNMKDFSLCWDSAHNALNEDDFQESIKVLAPYITRFHFADAITNKEDGEYGDNHRHFDDRGMMNVKTGKEIVHYFKKYSTKDVLYASVEARSLKDDDVWEKEYTYYQFLSEVLG